MSSEWEGWASEEQLQRLKQAGINLPFEIILTSLDRLTTYGFVKAEAVELVKKAQHFISSSALRGVKIIGRGGARGVISTGSTSLNNILGGGVKTGLVTDFFGESGVGKTQVAFQLCVNATLPKDQGGLGASPLFIDTVGTFRPERVAEMAEARGLRREAVLEKILVSEVRTLEEQLKLPRKVNDLSTSRKLGLMIIDTLTENFLQTYGGEEGLIQRQSLIGTHLHNLALLALNDDMAIVVTNMVRAGMSDSREVIEIGGNTVAQGLHKRVHLIHTEGRRVARLICPPLRIREAYFRIGEAGIID